MLQMSYDAKRWYIARWFQWVPTLGGECYWYSETREAVKKQYQFQWAPTLGGECYERARAVKAFEARKRFQWAPTLGGECYHLNAAESRNAHGYGFNGHPPLGVNATLEKPSLFSKSL